MPSRLSYPDWIVARLRAELGDDADAARSLRMNEPAPVTVRDDGYMQDLASQWVAAAVEARRASGSSTSAPRPAARPRRWPRPVAYVVAADLQHAPRSA